LKSSGAPWWHPQRIPYFSPLWADDDDDDDDDELWRPENCHTKIRKADDTNILITHETHKISIEILKIDPFNQSKPQKSDKSGLIASNFILCIEIRFYL
jgi:hypothetical protein